jgi:hypothetical protein
LAVLLATKTSTKPLVGISLGLLGTLLSVVYDLHRRVDRRIEGEDFRSRLLAALDKAPWLLKALYQIAISAESLLEEGGNKQLFEDLIDEKISDTKAYMDDLKRGHISVPVGSVTPMSNQIDHVKSTVRATTIPRVDNSWWLSPAGRDYLLRNQLAIEGKRKVSIERIILWDKDKQEVKEYANLARVIAEQRAAKVKVLFARRSKVTDPTLLTNIAIYDDQSYNDVIFNSDGVATSVEFYIYPRDARLAIARFEQLKGFATEDTPEELEPFLAALDEQADDPTDPEAGPDAANGG